MKLHCKFSIWNAVTLHDTFILTNKKNILRMREKSKCSFNDNWTRHWDIFNIFFAEINKKLQYFRKRRLFFITEFFLMNIWMRKLFLLCQSRVISRLMSSWMNFGVSFFHYFEHIFSHHLHLQLRRFKKCAFSTRSHASMSGYYFSVIKPLEKQYRCYAWHTDWLKCFVENAYYRVVTTR